MSSDPEAQLIAAARDGDLRAFAELVAVHQHSIRTCLVVRVSELQDAEDLAQDAFIIAHGKLGEFEPGRSFRAWVRGIALNLLRNHQRKLRPEPRGHIAELEALTDQAVEEDHAAGGEPELLEAAARCLDKLDQPSRELLRLRYTEARPLAELCEQLRRKHSAITMWLHRIRAALRDCIERTLSEVPR
jgi:RNA polymerase sigma-70 factor (ECF subfamily)